MEEDRVCVSFWLKEVGVGNKLVYLKVELKCLNVSGNYRNRVVIFIRKVVFVWDGDRKNGFLGLFYVLRVCEKVLIFYFGWIKWVIVVCLLRYIYYFFKLVNL